MVLRNFQAKRPPGVAVYQQITSGGVTLAETAAQPALVIGKKVLIKDDLLTGVYTPGGSGITYSFPEYESASKVYKNSVQVVLKDIVFAVDSVLPVQVYPNTGTLTGVVGSQTVGKQDKLTDSSANFTGNVLVNDTIEMVLPNGVAQAKVLAVLSATELQIDVSLPLSIASVVFVVKRSAGFVALGTTDQLRDTTTVNAFANVLPSDKVTITHPTQGIISANVVEVIDIDQIRLDKSFVPTTNIQYKITRTNASALTIVPTTGANTRTGSFTPDIGQTTTNILQNIASDVDFSNVLVGDKIRLIVGTNIVDDVVVGKIDLNKLQLAKSYTVNSVSYIITRAQETNAPYTLTTQVTASDTNNDGFVDTSGFSLPASITIGGSAVDSAKVYTSYTALSIKDANTLVTVNNDTEIETKSGKYDPKNPFGIGITLAAANTVKKVYGIPIGGEGNLDWLKALGIAESYRMYNISMLTNDPTLVTYGITHADGMSAPTKGKWRVLWCNLPHPYEGINQTTKPGGIVDYVTGSPSDYLTLYDPFQDFTLAPIDGFIQFTYLEGTTPVTKFFKIIDRINVSTIKLDNHEYAPPIGLPAGKGAYLKGVVVTNAGLVGSTTTAFQIQGSYKMFHILEKTEQSQAIANQAYSIGNRRVIYITNEECVLTFNGTDLNQPGFYLTSAYAGLSAETRPHQPLTGILVKGVKGVRRASEYWDSDEMGVIAAGGGWIVDQALPDDGLPSAYHQLTTDSTSVKTAEFSVTKNLDEISFAIFDGLGVYTGKNNKVNRTLDAANKSVQTTIAQRQKDEDGTQGSILGPQIISFSYTGFIEDPNILDLAASTLKMVLPNPLNYLDVYEQI